MFMRLIKTKCPNCGADLTVDLDNLQLYCQYCGAKLMIDVDNIDDLLIEKEHTKQEQESTKRSQEETRRKYVDQAISERKEKRDMKTVGIAYGIFVAIIIVVLIIADIGSGIRHIKSDITRKPGQITLTEPTNNMTSSENYLDLEADLRIQGFTNFVEVPVSEVDKIYSDHIYDGKVLDVTINGHSARKYDNFDKDAVIKITYYKK
ncbi:TFIIB-type zinc ribbon-containing protein [Lactimicrobium massiliense]|uniref:TFIIB-type zinc ribbon-containing protein n=1 Tax=Lactimicrobium massiliense TaxID=2161814 RepID=UPI00107F6B5A|nr:TFIIB-type zinc ribbon-containing protein [Lactimicrobium massiliense]